MSCVLTQHGADAHAWTHKSAARAARHLFALTSQITCQSNVDVAISAWHSASALGALIMNRVGNVCIATQPTRPRILRLQKKKLKKKKKNYKNRSKIQQRAEGLKGNVWRMRAGRVQERVLELGETDMRGGGGTEEAWTLCAQALSDADMCRMRKKNNNNRPAQNNNLFHMESLSCDVWKGQSVLLLLDLWECRCASSRGHKRASTSVRLLMFNIQGPISVNIILIAPKRVCWASQSINKTRAEASGDLMNLWLQL